MVHPWIPYRLIWFRQLYIATIYIYNRQYLAECFQTHSSTPSCLLVLITFLKPYTFANNPYCFPRLIKGLGEKWTLGLRALHRKNRTWCRCQRIHYIYFKMLGTKRYTKVARYSVFVIVKHNIQKTEQLIKFLPMISSNRPLDMQ